MPEKELSKHIIRKTITNARIHLVAAIHQLPIEEWTDADVDMIYEIMHDPDILEAIPSLVGGVK